MNPVTILFIITGSVMLVAAMGMITARNMVYSALLMALVLLGPAVLYLIYQAPFLAMVQVAVYAGGIVVLVLFVIMLVGADKMAHSESLRWQRSTVLGMVVIFLLETVYLATQAPLARATATDPEFGGPTAVGLALFSRQLLPLEVVSVLLLVAMIGVLVLAPRKRKKQ